MSADLRGRYRLAGHARLFLLVAPLMLTACEWFTDFKRQPSLWTWEPVKDSLTASRGNPQFSVPTTGTAVAGFQVSYGAFPATIDSMSNLRNPTPPNDSSLANGRKYFAINCTPCHGDRAMGDGPATKFGMPGINLTSDVTKARTDGYIFGMIRNGRGLMPPYNRIEEMDRWDVVNYLRALQGVNGKTVQVGPLAPPGVTGDKVPGATTLGPNRSAPFAAPRTLLPGAQATISPRAAAQQGLAAPARTDTSASASTDSANRRQPTDSGNRRQRSDSARVRDSVRARATR